MSVFKIRAAAEEILSAINALDIQQEHPSWRERYEWLCTSITNLHQEAQSLYEDMQQNGLKFSSIEAEGYLRAMKTVTNEIARIDEHFAATDVDSSIPVLEAPASVAPVEQCNETLIKKINNAVADAINSALMNAFDESFTLDDVESKGYITLSMLGFDDIDCTELIMNIEDALEIEIDDEKFDAQYPEIEKITVKQLISFISEQMA